jgi:hypothetical protein
MEQGFDQEDILVVVIRTEIEIGFVLKGNARQFISHRIL